MATMIYEIFVNSPNEYYLHEYLVWFHLSDTTNIIKNADLKISAIQACLLLKNIFFLHKPQRLCRAFVFFKEFELHTLTAAYEEKRG